MRIAFPLQQWLHEGASLLRYTYIACLVILYSECNFQVIIMKSNKILLQ